MLQCLMFPKSLWQQWDHAPPAAEASRCVRFRVYSQSIIRHVTATRKSRSGLRAGTLEFPTSRRLNLQTMKESRKNPGAQKKGGPASKWRAAAIQFLWIKAPILNQLCSTAQESAMLTPHTIIYSPAELAHGTAMIQKAVQRGTEAITITTQSLTAPTKGHQTRYGA